MPADNPQVGELWSLPDQPTLTTSGEGGRAVAVETTGPVAGRVVLLSELAGRRLVIPLRSFLLTWHYERTLAPEACSVEGCSQPSWFNQPAESPRCPTHYEVGQRIHFRTAQENRCPVCNNSEVEVVLTDLLTIPQCRRCRAEWFVIAPANTDHRNIVRRVTGAARVLEERELRVRLRMGSPTFRLLQPTISPGNPPQLHGLPIGVVGHDFDVYVIGSRPQETVKGVKQLGGLGGISRPEVPPPQEPTPSGQVFTNETALTPKAEAPRNLTIGARWWHKARFDQVYIIEVGTSSEGMFVKFRSEGVVERVSLVQFMNEFQAEPPKPPCEVGEEWVDSQDIVVTIIELDDQGAIVQGSQGSNYLLPYKQFPRWKKVERKSIYDRLNEDD